jgi:regulator of RNase E activity RraA
MQIEGLEPLPDGTLEALRRASTASVTSELAKLGIRYSHMTGVDPLTPGQQMVGEAITLRYVPAREDKLAALPVSNREHPQRKAIDNISPSQILVIDARGDLRSGTLGEILMARLKARGAAGMVTDGAVRDAVGIRGVGLPTFVGGIHAAASNTIHVAADINAVIGCGGIMVCPGDVLLGDDDGVVVIPRHLAGQVAKAAAEHDELEAYIYQRISGGESLFGIYPPNEQTLRDYEDWKRTQ